MEQPTKIRDNEQPKLMAADDDFNRDSFLYCFTRKFTISVSLKIPFRLSNELKFSGFLK